MPLVDQEIATYERLRPSLEAEHHLKWAVIHGETLVGTYADFQKAAEEAVRRFGRGPYLIRRIGAPPIRLPSTELHEPARPVSPTAPSMDAPTAALDQEIATYHRLRPALEAVHLSKWAVIHGKTFVGAFPTFEEAAREAARCYGRGPYLIREIGAPRLRACIPSSWPVGPMPPQELVFHDPASR